jgi:phenylacetate-CoA ligase
MNNSIVRYVTFPLHEVLKGRKTFKYLNEIDKTQWMSQEEIEGLQFEKLKRFIEHAYRTVPYYRLKMDEYGIKPESIQDFNDYKKMPYLSKDDIRRHMDYLVSSTVDKEKLIKFSTGGSTGEPLLFYMDSDRGAHVYAFVFRNRKWWGVGQHEKEVIFWGSPIELNTQGVIKNIRDIMINSKLLSFFDATEENLFKYLKFIRSYRPRFMYGYASAFYLFSLFLKKQKIDVKSLGVKVIFTTAEKLYDYQREVIEETFNCPVAVEYGSRDGGFIAQECPEGNLHVNAEGIYLEIDSRSNFDGPEGNKGEIVITNLNTQAFPFIRYRTGDVGELADSQCPCGRGLPVLKSVDGRKTDFLVNRDGRIIHALGAIYIIRELEGVKKFRIHQKSAENLKIEMVVNDMFDNENSGLIRSEIEKLFGHELSIEINMVDDISVSKSGKYSYVTSDVTASYMSNNGADNPV